MPTSRKVYFIANDKGVDAPKEQTRQTEVFSGVHWRNLILRIKLQRTRRALGEGWIGWQQAFAEYRLTFLLEYDFSIIEVFHNMTFDFSPALV